ncbi:hypothetical protein MTP04_18070 [Lysinibacillus sp. PLM2]|nr:hypothetical protein MTP04_18070 [Lysinibacillus sp. PLM2]
MIGLIIAVIFFNTVAFITVKQLTKSQMAHMWIFTILLHLLVDLYLGLKYHGYYYFNKGIEWIDLPAVTLITPPVVLLFLNRFPFRDSFLKRFVYIILWSIVPVIYEALALLPQPWGFFHYGWWKLTYSAIVYPVLLTIIVSYYMWICHLEKKN